MNVFQYPFGNVVGDFIIIGPIKKELTLVYRVSTEMFPKFSLIISSIQEICEKVGVNDSIAFQDTINEYSAFKIYMSQDNWMSRNKGFQMLLEACENYYMNYMLSMDNLINHVIQSTLY